MEFRVFRSGLSAHKREEVYRLYCQMSDDERMHLFRLDQGQAMYTSLSASLGLDAFMRWLLGNMVDKSSITVIIVDQVEANVRVAWKRAVQDSMLRVWSPHFEGKSSREIANLIRVSKSDYEAWLSGKRLPAERTIRRVERYLRDEHPGAAKILIAALRGYC